MTSFEWDFTKELENIRKHRVSFVEATTCFLDSKGFQLTDEKHSKGEVRCYWVGRSECNRVLTIRYTTRGRTIRIFGAAEWRKWRRLYYERTKTD